MYANSPLCAIWRSDHSLAPAFYWSDFYFGDHGTTVLCSLCSCACRFAPHGPASHRPPNFFTSRTVCFDSSNACANRTSLCRRSYHEEAVSPPTAFLRETGRLPSFFQKVPIRLKHAASSDALNPSRCPTHRPSESGTVGSCRFCPGSGESHRLHELGQGLRRAIAG